ncbi:glycosyltransferase family 39 protein [Hyphobacterium sp. HN65]|uniref:Glycosyltransferase family 39 protein n=1 Tax=Hyphobacterium lacteum TaxID=3116575 RepID=A0ABU7LPT3_9PROT|nr:glycosyltransferase family 39 protein [Hyphobacterium sp. HN65]MEE2525918.1 glycosyltransferase family 39 protein [Hyphobacterium sp. HN65]
MQALSNWLFSGESRWGLTYRAWLVLALIALLAMAPGLSSQPVMDRDEARYAQAATQMMETGDYVDIRFQEDPRHVKPAGIYWMQVLSALPFGGADADIWAFRLPSLIGMLIAVFGTAWLGARLFGPQVGLTAGLLLAVALMSQVEARTAKTDGMLLAAGVLAQIGLIMMLLKAEAGERLKFIGWPLLFWAASGAAIMIKGPIITMVSALTLLGYFAFKHHANWLFSLFGLAVVIEVLKLLGLEFLPGGIAVMMGGLAGIFVFDLIRDQETRSALGKFHWLKGLTVLAAIALPWLIAINIATDWGFLQESVGHALFGKVGEADDSHGGPFLYHSMLSPAIFWPGSALLGLAILAGWAGRKSPDVRLLIVWALPTWIVFEFVQTKLPHYVLPAFPALALLAGIGLSRIGELLTGWKSKTLHFAWIGTAMIAGLVIAAIPIYGAIELGDDELMFAYIALGTGIVAVIAIGWLALRPDIDRIVPVTGLAALTYLFAFGFAIPSVEAAWPSSRVHAIVEGLQGCDAYPAATAGYREPSNVFYLGTHTALTDGAGAADHLLAYRDCGIAVVDASEREAFMTAIEGHALRTLGHVAGVNLVKGDELSLDILTLDESRVSAPQQ